MDDPPPVYNIDGQKTQVFAVYNLSGINPHNETLTAYSLGAMTVYDRLAIASLIIILTALLLGFMVQFYHDRNMKKKEIAREAVIYNRPAYFTESNV